MASTGRGNSGCPRLLQGIFQSSGSAGIASFLSEVEKIQAACLSAQAGGQTHSESLRQTSSLSPLLTLLSLEKQTEAYLAHAY